VQIEAEEGKQRGILVPALLDDVKIPLPFRRVQAENLVNWSGEVDHAEFQALCRGVLAIVGAETTATPFSRAPAGAATELVAAIASPGEGVRFPGTLGPMIGNHADEEQSTQEKAEAAKRAEEARLKREKAEAAAKLAEEQRLGQERAAAAAKRAQEERPAQERAMTQLPHILS